MQNIRNFSIIAHIDHGKSTLADRLIEKCGGLESREMKSQVLDSMPLEQERGITIKAQTVRLKYIAKDGVEYILNLIDTPGHVDFGYEVSRSLAACEGSILVVDASQGVEAQTLVNVYKAIEADNEIFVALNKVDLPAAEPERVAEQIENVIGLDTTNAVKISAKTGLGIEDVLDAIIEYLPPPEGNVSAPLKAMLVDSWYDQYIGVVILIRVIDGVLYKGMTVRMLSNNVIHTVDMVGVFTPKKVYVNELRAGEIGFITASIKQLTECNVGDTITEDKKPCDEALPGFKKVVPVVFCSLYPTDAGMFEFLKDALAKLNLNDSSFSYETESSSALGFGFRCGFLGLLHLEIIQERIMREFNIDIITTSPGVVYRIHLRAGEFVELHNPNDMPDPTKIDKMEEPWVRATIILPDQYLGAVLDLCTQKRGEQVELNYIGERVMLVYLLPLNEIVYDFYDNLKSCSRGYASFDWEAHSYRVSDLVVMRILVNSEPVDALATIVHRSRSESRGRELCTTLKDLIPKHMFAIPIQAAIGGKIIARETISAMRKDVTAKCYGGDITRKRKLLEKQKEGKKKMRSIGRVSIPQSAFIAVLKTKKN